MCTYSIAKSVQMNLRKNLFYLPFVHTFDERDDTYKGFYCGS